MHRLLSNEQVLFPACAGVILTKFEKIAGKYSFPRVCGGDPIVHLIRELITLFSPRVRG